MDLQLAEYSLLIALGSIAYVLAFRVSAVWKIMND